MIRYSIVVPAYNEEKTVALFYNAITPVMQSLGESYELIFVNDGSNDGTQKELDALADKDALVKVCSLSRNFGQQAAMLCGLEHASGDAVVTMDADLQDEPKIVLQMIEKWKEGYQIVHGKRLKRKGETLFKKATASLFYGFTRKITGMEIPSNVGDFKLYDRAVVDVLLSMGEHDRLLRAQTAWIGFKQAFVEFDRPERVAGKTHYSVKKMVKLAQAGIFPNTDYTLTLPIKLGLIFGTMSVACFIVFIALACAGVDFGGLTAWLFPTLCALTAVLLVCQGLANMHTAMIYREVQNRPKYIVAETFNMEK